MNKYADKTSVERSVERWENEGGDVLPIALRNKERAAIEKQENKNDDSFERENVQKNQTKTLRVKSCLV
jgi:hypothetical protein